MITCFKDLYDYELVLKCCRCKSICLKINFSQKCGQRGRIRFMMHSLYEEIFFR